LTYGHIKDIEFSGSASKLHFPREGRERPSGNESGMIFEPCVIEAAGVIAAGFFSEDACIFDASRAIGTLPVPR
jgi:hypothetical protein